MNNELTHLSWKSNFQFNLVSSNGQVVTSEHVLATIKDRTLSDKYLGVTCHHCLNNLTVDLSRALVGSNGNIVMVKETTRHGNREVICT